MSQSGGRLHIEPLLSGATGSHYNGILSQSALDVTGAAVSMEAVTGPSSSTTADMMFTLSVDGQNHYRIFLEQGYLKFERRTAAYAGRCETCHGLRERGETRANVRVAENPARFFTP